MYVLFFVYILKNSVFSQKLVDGKNSTLKLVFNVIFLSNVVSRILRIHYKQDTIFVSLTIFSYTMNMEREITNNKNEIKNFLSNEANVDIQLTRDTAAQNILREKCSKAEFFSGPNTGKYGPEENSVFGHFSRSDNPDMMQFIGDFVPVRCPEHGLCYIDGAAMS